MLQSISSQSCASLLDHLGKNVGLDLLRLVQEPRTKDGLSPREILHGRPYIVQKEISMQVGDKVLSEYMVSLAKQLKKIEQAVFGARA